MKPDPLLETIIKLGSALGDSSEGRAWTEITLVISGMLVSGRIISDRQFMLAHPTTNLVLEVEDKKLSMHAPARLEHSNDEGIKFFQLSHVRFFIAGMPEAGAAAGVVYFRGRLADVSGFTLGILSPPGV